MSTTKPKPTDEATTAGREPDSAPRDETIGLALKLWVVLNRAHAAVAELDQRSVASHGLSGREFAVLEALYHKGPLVLSEVRRKILSSSGGITYLIDRLEGRGLVERRECETDRRVSYAALTPSGESLMDRIFPVHASRLARALGGLDEDESREAIRLLRKAGHYAAGLGGGEEGTG